MKLSILVATVSVLAGCAHYKASPIVPNAPDWVNKSAGAFKDKGVPVFYGVGAIQGVRNIPAAREAAADRGRGAIAKVMNSYTTVLSKDYAASVTAGDMSKSSEEQMISQTQKVFSKFTLVGSMPVDYYVDRNDPKNPVTYCLVELDMSAAKKALEESKELDAKMRDYVKANADKAFDELAAEEAKH
jgi:hypothetical protein